MKNTNLQFLKKGIWVYFILLIMEGGLRRWFLPSLATPLLIIRDPLAAYLLFTAYRFNFFPKYRFLPLLFWIGIISIFTALFFGHGNVFVALFGARILLIQFPMLCLIACIFDRSDVIEMGKVILWLSIPMAILISLQFYSPQSAWVNRGVGDELGGAGFSGANGYFRPPGTFSFISGTASFFGLVACFVFYFWLQPKYINKLVLISATLALLVAIPTSISRSLFFGTVISLLFFLVAKSSQPGFLKNMVQLLLGFLVLIIVVLSTDKFNTQIEAFTARFTSANEIEGGLDGVLIDRFLGGLVGAFIHIDDSHAFFGQGIGMGTNVGAQLLSGKTAFLISEGEWGRLIGESGMLFGTLIILVRISMTATISIQSFKFLRRGDALPWMLLSFGFINLLQAQWAQPTNLGFYVLIGGLILASLKKTELQKIKY
ncbi:hypothetical protein [Flavobacterium sp. 120]|uniref:hypothetical protein n=1 Tax=Flavobacterium sp. 120 TaxID=2135626 RepID=UPI000F1041DF|nr:hypothetical protein [Flavobacterium sp. 120]RKS13306.1 hypothetical protein C8C87_0516 [Flavobacterium sp. 120]